MIPLDDSFCVRRGFSNPPSTRAAIAAATTSKRSSPRDYGSPLCIVKLGCWGPVVQCNVGKRGWMGGVGGCPNVGGICIGCTMPGFPDKFMPFMDQPPGSMLSSEAVMSYGRAIRALRRFTQASLNREPASCGAGGSRSEGLGPVCEAQSEKTAPIPSSLALRPVSRDRG